MKLLVMIATVSALFPLTAGAKSLDEARQISARIELATAGHIKVLSDTADDELFSKADFLENLNLILSAVERNPRLAKATPKEVGILVVELIGLVTQYPPEQLHSHTPVKIKINDAQERFCRLSTKMCDLFSDQISQDICTADGGSQLLM